MNNSATGKNVYADTKYMGERSAPQGKIFTGKNEGISMLKSISVKVLGSRKTKFSPVELFSAK